jgi:hypothetical protein
MDQQSQNANIYVLHFLDLSVRISATYIYKLANSIGDTNGWNTHSDVGRTTSVRFMTHQVVEYKV